MKCKKDSLVKNFFQEGNMASFEVPQKGNLMSVNIAFSHAENDYDETQFDVSSYDWDELDELFNDFIVENNFEHVEVTGVQVVDFWTERGDA